MISRRRDRIRAGNFATDLNLVGNRFNPETSRVMVCGSIDFNHEMAQMLQDHGLVEGNNSLLRGYVLERSFVG